jgi:hypothetical protein
MCLHLPVAAGPPLLFRLSEPGLRFAQWADTNSMNVVADLNMPVMFVQIPYAMVSPDKREWAPPGMDRSVWRAIAWPILGMFFWWIAGRGTEALVAARQKRLSPQIHWLETIVSLLLVAMGVLVVMAFTFGGPTRSDESDLFLLVLVMAILWGFLGGLSVAAKIAQSSLNKLGN